MHKKCPECGVDITNLATALRASLLTLEKVVEMVGDDGVVKEFKTLQKFAKEVLSKHSVH